MSMSGIKVADNCAEKLAAVKTKRTLNTAFFHIHDDIDPDTRAKVSKIAPLRDFEDKLTFDELVGIVKTEYIDCPLYILYNFTFLNPKTKSETDKVVIINWCNDDTPVKKRMVHASSFGTVTKFCDVGISVEIHSLSDFTEEAIMEKIPK